MLLESDVSVMGKNGEILLNNGVSAMGKRAKNEENVVGK
jgi:hypothetical protein